MRDFTRIRVWSASLDVATSIYEISRLLPHDERFGLTAQLRRAALSVSSNIAEGCGRDSRKDQVRFLSMAVGSANEVHSLVAVAARLGLLDQDVAERAIDDVVALRKRLIAFKKTVV